MLKTDIFQRTETTAPIISAPFYNFLIGVILGWGFLFNYFIVLTVDATALLQSTGLYLFLALYFACCLVGCRMFNQSKKPWVSFLGYNLVVLPFGLIIDLCVSLYKPEIVIHIIEITGTVTLTMMILGTIFPKFFQAIRNTLIIALSLVIGFELFLLFLGKNPSGFVDWIPILLICGYIGYDWGRANQIPKTIDNAVDSAAALYMDIINLFLRLLRAKGRSKN